MTKRKVALVKGDGSGPEMMAIACAVVVEAARKHGLEIEFVETPMGWNTFGEFGDTLPEKFFSLATEIGVVFFGGVGDPALDNTIGVEKPEMKPEVRCLLALRERMGLLLNFRPMIYYKELDYLANVRSETIPRDGVKQIWIRFLLEDSYFGNKYLIPSICRDDRETIGLKLKSEVRGNEFMISDVAFYQKETLEKYFRAAFAYAKAMGLPLISIDKANIMARYDYWRKIVTKIGREEFSDVKLIHQLVDSANALLFKPAELEGVIACGNEHGDILTDGAASAMGSMGMMCSSSVNPDTGAAMFESGAGTAPKLAGQNKANPMGRILAGAMMLNHLDCPRGAADIEEAVRSVLKQGFRTADLWKSDDICGPGHCPAKTSEIGELILSNL